MRTVLLRHFVALVGLVALSSTVVLHVRNPNLAPIHSDGYSYYVYLPDWFLFHDTTLEAVADDCCGGTYPRFTGINRWPGTGRWVNTHPIGVAMMTAPFFGLAHALTRWSNLPPDGFSLYYQHAVSLAALCYLLMGLAILRRQLSARFSAGVVVAALTALTFGTNLFHHAVYDASFSHVFAFFLVAALMALTDRWWRAPSGRVSAALAGVSALLVLVRHPDLVILGVVPLAGVVAWRDVGSRSAALLARWRLLLAMLALASICILPQLLLYHEATARWIVSSYGGVGSFSYLRSPRILQVLFSVQKGLFFWSPVLLFAAAGMIVARGWAAGWRLAAAAVFTVQTIIVASWHDWQFGGSFGHRGFTDMLPLFAPFLASFFAWSAARPRARAVVAVVATAAVSLSVFQMLQYWAGIIPIMDTTWEQYRALFLRWR